MTLIQKCPYCDGRPTTGGFSHDIDCPRGNFTKSAMDSLKAGDEKITEIIRLRDALSYCLNMAGTYTINENVRLALITQRCRDELARETK